MALFIRPSEGIATTRIPCERIDSRPELELLLTDEYFNDKNPLTGMEEFGWHLIKCIFINQQALKNTGCSVQDVMFILFQDFGVNLEQEELWEKFQYYRWERSYIYKTKQEYLGSKFSEQYRLTKRGRRALK